MKTVSAASVAANRQRIDRLPPLVQGALGELAGAAKEGLLAQQADFEGLFEAMTGLPVATASAVVAN